MEDNSMNTTAQTARDRRRRVPLSMHEKVDVCRGLFAALVVVAHAQYIAWGVHPRAAQAMSAAQRGAISNVIGLGTIYVMGFFVISGYCIHLSVARQMREERFPLVDYLAARGSRILPLYYLGLLFAVAAEWLIASARPYVWPHGVDLGTLTSQLLVVQNLTQTYGSYAPTWSITNEAFYYLFYGLLVAWLSRGRSARPAWVGLGLCAATAAVTQVLYVTVARTPVVYGTGMLLGLGMIWFTGVLVAIHGARLIRVPAVKALTRTWPLLVVGVMAWAYAGLPPHGQYLISGAAFTLMLLGFLDAPKESPRGPVSPWRAKAIESLGLMSYPMYLFHGPLMMLAGSWILRSRVTTDWRVTFVLLTVVGLASGVVLGWLVEKPLMARRAAWLKQRKTRPAGFAPGRTPALGGVTR
jgi:peptidoglycan/LPS O-acetylase OafA/YrhL